MTNEKTYTERAEKIILEIKAIMQLGDLRNIWKEAEKIKQEIGGVGCNLLLLIQKKNKTTITINCGNHDYYCKRCQDKHQALKLLNEVLE